MSEGTTEPKSSYEQLRIWLSFAKFVLGTVTVGLITTWVNAEIQEKRLEFEVRSKENSFIAQFVDNALDENLEKRRDFAEYFVRLAPTVESRMRWTEYRDYADALVIEAQQKAEKIAVRERELIALKDAFLEGGSVAAGVGNAAGVSSAHGGAENVALRNKITELEAEIAKQRRELAVIRSESAAAIVIVPNVVGLDPSSASNVIQSAGLSPWFKSGESRVDILPGHVGKLSPPPGTKLARGEAVEVFTTPEQ
jgi:hypothetical protein